MDTKARETYLEKNELRAAVKAFVDAEILPNVEEWERNEAIPSRELFRRAGRAGLLGITKPLAYGGLGLDYSYNTVYIEEVARCRSNSVATALGVQTDVCTPALAKYGSAALCEEFLRPSISGERIGCLGVSETGAGSDVASLKTSARRVGDEYIINGAKMWITNGAQADWICLLANTAESGGPHKNKSLIVVPLNAKGVSRSKPLSKHGLRASDTAQIFFDDVRIPVSYRIGEENLGFRYQMEQFEEERLFSAIRTTTQLERAIDITVEYTSQREAFDETLFDKQWVAFNLAQLATDVALLRALWEKAVAQYVAGKNVNLLAAMAKMQSGQLARKVPDQCLQFFGGQGYMWESEISRIARDLRLAAIGGGAIEIMMTIVAKQLRRDADLRR